jgi:hypothetical protein
MEGPEPQSELVAEPAVTRPATVVGPSVGGPTGLGATVVSLQRSAGNRAVLTWLARSAVARAPADPRAVKAETMTPAQADKLTLAEFNGFTERQSDWASQPKFIAAPKIADELRVVVEIGQEFKKEFLSAAGELTMKDLRVAARTDAGKLRLRSYGIAITKFGWRPARTVKEAVAWGEAVPKLESALTTDVVRETVKQGTEGTNVADLVNAKAVDDFIEFVQKTNPLLSASDGSEIRSFLRLKAEANWRDFAGKIGPVRSLHHFSKATLLALRKNVAATGHKKPLAVVLHTAVDHNGAFHRDPNIAQVVSAPQNVTILIEGSPSLAAAGASLVDVVNKYGKGAPPKARQIMLAGHGNSRVTELAGDRDSTGKIVTEDVNLDSNTANSVKLINVMLDNLESTPTSQIVLNGCLTSAASTSLPAQPGPPDEKKAADDLKKGLQARRSLADTIRDMAAAKGLTAGQVSASNSSFGSEVSLIDPASGRLGLRSNFDPLLTSADKFKYLAKSGEATGAGRALVEALLTDPVKAEAAVKRRLTISVARTDWDDRVIKALYREALVDLKDVIFINQAAALAGDLSEIQFADEARPSHLSGADPVVLDRLLGRLEGDPIFKNQKPPLMKVVSYQVWMLTKPAKRAKFLAALGQMTVQDAAQNVDLDVIQPEMAALLPDPPSADAAGELRVALMDVTRTDGTDPDPASIAYLRKRRSGSQFADPRKVTSALGGRSSASAVLETIKEPVPAGPAAKPGAAAPPPANYNIDLDNDGTNDAFVEPLVAQGFYTSRKGGGPPQKVFAKPDATSAVLGTIADGSSVNVVGKSGAWYCIEFGASKRPGFVRDLLV